jgi:HK97 family phage major capsid protein
LSEKVRTIATWIPASKQILDDFTELANFISTSIGYYVGLEEELQLLSGDGTGENLHGLVPQASQFNKALLPATGATKIDAIGAAISQITTSKELPPTFCILHPADWWSMRLLKDSLGRYLLTGAQSTAAPNLFDLTVIPTTSMALGSFLVGSGNAAASEIRDRQEMVVEVSTEHQDYFIKNLVAVRGEKRLALVVKRPASYVTGTFTTTGGSPLSAPSNGSSPA